LNLFGKNRTADYVNTGIWSKKAMTEAGRYGQVSTAAQVVDRDGMAYIPHQMTWKLNKDADYVHYTPNETIDGLEFQWVPETGEVPLVADMTSMILSRPVDVNQFGVIYAGAQKNIGQAGVTVVIVRKDLIKESLPNTPTLYQYKLHAEHQSFYNTPPTYSWYMSGLVLAWMKRRGGIPAFYAANVRKAKKIYSILDTCGDFYVSRIHPECRSMMNAMFYLKDESLTPRFMEEAEKLGMHHLRGHRVSGGVRASMYNAMPEESVSYLVDFMVDFARRNG
jgi:phosphoserine aminotransferase